MKLINSFLAKHILLQQLYRQSRYNIFQGKKTENRRKVGNDQDNNKEKTEPSSNIEPSKAREESHD